MPESLETLRELLSDPFVAKLGSAAIGLLGVVILVMILKRVVSRYVQEATTRYRVRKSVSFFGYFLGALVLLVVFSDRLGQLTVIFGVAGAGIAFALQEVIASIAGWAAISFGGFYEVGDRVEVGGIRGDVIDIGVLRTTIAEVGQWVNGDLYNGRVARVANSFVFKEPVVNYSGDFPFLWDEIVLPIRFGSDLDKTKEMIESVGKEICGEFASDAAEIWKQMTSKYPVELATTEPLVTLTFDENWVSFTLRYPVRFDRRRTTKHELSYLLLKHIESAGDSISLGATGLELFPMKPFSLEGR